MKLSKEKILLLVVILAVFLAHAPILRGFFQQDEWLAFGNFFAVQQQGMLETALSFFTPNIAHYVPFHNFTFHSLFSIFGLNYQSWAISSLLWHVLITYLVFVFASRIFQNTRLSLLAAALFGLNASGHQATSWVVSDINTHGASIFGVLSLILFFDFLKTKQRKAFWTSMLALIASLLFKEITIGLFFLLPVAFYLFADKLLIKQRFYPIAVLGVGLLYAFFRVSMFLFPSVALDAPVVTGSQSAQHLAYNLATFPIKGVAQTIIPPPQLLRLASLMASFSPEDITGQVGTTAYNIFVEQRVLELLSTILFLLIFIGVVIIWRRKKGRLRKVAVFGLIFVALNSFVFAFSPERSGIISVIDSRNLYFSSIGAAVLLTSVASMVSAKKIAKTFVFLLPFFILNIFWLNQELTALARSGSLRRDILTQIKREYPDLADKTIFYTESDKAFYGLPSTERIFPFQSGFGQTLLVWYYPTENFPKEFFEDGFLWEITEQGYKGVEDRGFGYFRDFELLAKTISEEDIPLSSVIAFRWDSDGRSVEDVTEEVRGSLAGYFTDKRIINPRSFSVSASENSQDVRLALDGDRATFWDSGLPYAYYQFLEIDLGKERNIAQILIDSYNNQNQNQVGYKVLFSKDRGEWAEVFFNKRYPPDENGLVNIYTEPKKGVRFIKIEQHGYNEFVTWIIHELKLYEAF